MCGAIVSSSHYKPHPPSRSRVQTTLKSFAHTLRTSSTIALGYVGAVVQTKFRMDASTLMKILSRENSQHSSRLRRKRMWTQSKLKQVLLIPNSPINPTDAISYPTVEGAFAGDQIRVAFRSLMIMTSPFRAGLAPVLIA
ncbi:uncharacterized protein LAJ45_10337 [Morchella importuna]|uniref:uncharacterized protein n=1 Tax=Morchella importuna TaxID=1174673 RepID=UPI001E8E4F86|nr:uncharacterized protein LAJ45_10337 [Morchella importuna]KAH8145697.1 hypothetical protein LAJ45_10337 [Morchella importuna]